MYTMLMKLPPALYYTGVELCVLVMQGGRGAAVVPIHPHASTMSSLGAKNSAQRGTEQGLPCQLASPQRGRE